MRVSAFNGFTDTCRVPGSCKRPARRLTPRPTRQHQSFAGLEDCSESAVCEHRRLGNQYGEIGINAGLIARLFELDVGLSEVHVCCCCWISSDNIAASVIGLHTVSKRALCRRSETLWIGSTNNPSCPECRLGGWGVSIWTTSILHFSIEASKSSHRVLVSRAPIEVN
jgi:hypothetical protein